MNAYDHIYLEQAMDTLGNMLEYAVSSCGQAMKPFYRMFLSSGIATQFAMGNPKYIAGMSGTELARAVAAAVGDHLPADRPLPEGERSTCYWTGWALAYIQWQMGCSFEYLEQNGLAIEVLAEAYPTLHETDLSKVLLFAEDKIRVRLEETEAPLRRFRRQLHLTQAELATQSGVSLRMIRAYEQKKQDLGKAEVRTVFNLSRVLGCTPADLVT